jgi:hypothetical protein
MCATGVKAKRGKRRAFPHGSFGPGANYSSSLAEICAGSNHDLPAADIEPAPRRYEEVRSRRTQAFIRLGPRIARVTTTNSTAIKVARSLAIRLLPQRLLGMSTVNLTRDPHRELRPRAV